MLPEPPAIGASIEVHVPRIWKDGTVLSPAMWGQELGHAIAMQGYAEPWWGRIERFTENDAGTVVTLMRV